MEFLRHRGAADHLAALDHLHAQAGHRQIGRAGEAVMARSDDDDVGFVHVCFRMSSIVIPGRVRRCETRNLEIPGSVASHHPGMTFQSFSEDVNVSTALSDASVPGPALPAILPYALSCTPRRPCRNPAAGARRIQAGAFMSLSDPSAVTDAAFRCPQPAGAGGLHGSDLRQRVAAVLGAAAVHKNGAAAARRLAGGVVGGDGVLPVAAARRLCLCALPDAAARTACCRWRSIWCCWWSRC